MNQVYFLSVGSVFKALICHLQREMGASQSILQPLFLIQHMLNFCCIFFYFSFQLLLPEVYVFDPLAKLVICGLLSSHRGGVGFPSQSVCFSVEPLSSCPLPFSVREVNTV